MTKKFLIDTNVLVSSPRCLYVFEDNDIYICDVTLEELDRLKNKQGEAGYGAREAIRAIGKIRNSGNLLNGCRLPGGGTCYVISTECLSNHLAHLAWSLEKADNKLINAAMDIDAVLVTNDVNMQIKADAAGLKTESFKNEEVSENFLQYTGQAEVYAPTEAIDEYYKTGIMEIGKLYYEKNDKSDYDLRMNTYVLIKDAYNPKHTALGRFDGKVIKRLMSEKAKPSGITPRNVAQIFALDALLAPVEEIPLVILKGSAGTAKTFLSLAVGLQKVMDDREYRRLLIFRPNIKFDEDIGFLKGDEKDKIMPLMRPCLDNLEALLCHKEDSSEEVQSRIDYLFDKGIIAAEAMAYLRGRSISNHYVLIDEAQNMTPGQALGAITRAGIGTKLVIVGDPDQIDNPKLDRRNNGLVYAAEKMLGSNYCAQLTFAEHDCVRSPLAADASLRMNARNSN